MFCRNCGAKIDDDAEFCPNCGRYVTGLDRERGAESLQKPVPDHGPNVTPTRKRSDPGMGFAIAGFVLGLAGTIGCAVFIPAVLAIVFSAIALKRAGGFPNSGSVLGFAIAGIVIGLADIAFGVVFYIVYGPEIIGQIQENLNEYNHLRETAALLFRI